MVNDHKVGLENTRQALFVTRQIGVSLCSILTMLEGIMMVGFVERQQLSVGTNEVGFIDALTYIAPRYNHAWLGDASDELIAEQIQHSRGPSGSNKDYVLSLHEALLADGIEDTHVQAIAALVR